MSIEQHNLNHTFAVIDPSQRVHPRSFSENFYQQIDEEFDGFGGHSLLSCHSHDSDWPTWEVHPAGDEVVCLISGSTTLVMMVNGMEQHMLLDEPGSYVIIPKNTWHTARTRTPCTLLFITPGEGTLNELEPPREQE